MYILTWLLLLLIIVFISILAICIELFIYVILLKNFYFSHLALKLFLEMHKSVLDACPEEAPSLELKITIVSSFQEVFSSQY